MVWVDPAWVALLSRRVEGETASEMRRHGETRRVGLYALYLMDHRCTMIDGLVDLLLELVHRLQTRSRRKVIGAIARDIERVHGNFLSACWSTLPSSQLLTIRRVGWSMLSIRSPASRS